MKKQPTKSIKLTGKMPILWIILVMVAALLIFLSWQTWAFISHPLYPSLSELQRLPTRTLAAAGEQTGYISSALTDLQNSILPTPEGYINPTPMGVFPSPTVSPNANLVCGGPPLMFILVVGNNNIEENNNADAVRVARIDFVHRQVSVLTLEREIWTNIPDLASHGITAMWFSASYSYGEAFLGKNMGIYLLSETIAQNFGVQSDHYVDVNLTSFAKAVDSVGGVDIYLPEPVIDNVWQHINLSAGWHHLDGDTAMRFVRVRYADSDWQRINRQTDVVKSLFNKLTSPANLPRLPGLALQVKDDFQTDLSPIEISELTCLAAQLPKDQIKFYEISPDMLIPTTLHDTAKSQLYLPKYDLIRPYIQQFINGTLP